MIGSTIIANVWQLIQNVCIRRKCYLTEPQSSIIEDKIQEVALQRWQSPAHKVIVSNVFAMGATSIVLYTGACAVIPTLVSGSLVMAVIAAVPIIFSKQYLFEITLSNTLFSHHVLGKPLYHEIVLDISDKIDTQHGNKLYLGAIPLMNNTAMIEQLLHIKETHGKLTIISALEESEFAPGIHIPIDVDTWEKLDVVQQKIQATDFQAMKLDDIAHGVQAIWEAKVNGAVYVHCKAGRGRSATLIICYLLKYQQELLKYFVVNHRNEFKTVILLQENLKKVLLTDMNTNELTHDFRFETATSEQQVSIAISYVLSQRPVINLNRAQTQAIQEWYELITNPPQNIQW